MLPQNEGPLLFERARHRRERRRQARTNCRDRTDDDHGDQCSDQSVLNCRRATFMAHKLLDEAHIGPLPLHIPTGSAPKMTQREGGFEILKIV